MSTQRQAIAAEKHLITEDLRRRGWTAGMIRRFYPVPAATRPNPRYRSAAPMKLYLARKVKRIEATSDFAEALATAQKQQEVAAKGVETKRQRAEAEVVAIRVDVPLLDPEELVERACRDYNALAVERSSARGHSSATPDSDPGFLDRICVNYLRHCLTRYEGELAAISGRVGAASLAQEIKSLVLDAIAKQYPWLAAECAKQKMRSSDRYLAAY